ERNPGGPWARSLGLWGRCRRRCLLRHRGHARPEQLAGLGSGAARLRVAPADVRGPVLLLPLLGGEQHAPKPRSLVEVALAQDRRPGDPAVVLHRVQVDAPFLPRGRRGLLRLVEGLPRDLGLHDVAGVLVAGLVERAVHDHGAVDLTRPLLMAERAVWLLAWLVVPVEPRVEDQVLRV